MSSVPGSSDEWQVAVMEDAGKQMVQFRMELESGIEGRDPVRRSVLEALRRQSISAWQAYDGGLVGIDFRFYEKGALRTKRKLMRLVDERNYA